MGITDPMKYLDRTVYIVQCKTMLDHELTIAGYGKCRGELQILAIRKLLEWNETLSYGKYFIHTYARTNKYAILKFSAYKSI